ncbi:putative enzyme involved in biosynthesis of extracellular polysaccharides [Fictibacillus macauensis ZFHKF-1]|uniref:Putative enzyme involved in biosynthesis of extracellular polysaccharides n=1 Tax=Fictibacillus macauensis ZFHKF-1 TaxID=1196324 RepID=I8J6H2_9BACL|nr:antibiotic biosynthesis monooxygenase family protein [Fictibacillus macauensis]EIT87416.1 putative enzyme involved in biosynthesis of extracellular polysaccharides [Fictibacillus macauensis ZFHKF-1]
MYIVHSTFAVPEGKAEEVISIYKNRSRSVDQAEGFIDFLLLQNEKRPGEITVQLTFETKEQYLSWVRSQQFKDIHDLEKKYPDQELAAIVPTVRQYKVVAT